MKEVPATTLALVAPVALIFAAGPPSGALTLSAEATTARRSEIQARSDFDGDGFTDLAVGALSDGRFGGPEGSVTIMYGPIDGDSELRVERLTQLNAEPNGSTGRDPFGDTLAVGDFDGDGFTDLAVGAPRRSEGDVYHNGSVYIFFGSASGLQSGQSLILTQSDFSVSLDRQAGAFFGDELAAGDLDGDGTDDLVIGAKDAYVGGHQSAGAIYVAMGGPEELTPTARITQDSAGVPGRASRQHYFGWSLAIGQLGAGAAPDLVVGAPGERDRGRPFVGAVFVFYGTGDGSFGRVQQIRQRDLRGAVADRFPEFGKRVEVADFGRGRLEDLAVAAPGEGDRGVVRILYGRSIGVTAGRAQRITMKSLGFRKNAAYYFGASLAAGNLGRGGRADLVVGDPYRAIEGKEGAGVAVVVYGGADGLRRGNPQLLTRRKLLGRPPRLEANFSLGLALGDFEGEGRRCGLVVGVPGSYAATHAGEEVLVVPAARQGPRRGAAKRWNQNLLFGAGERDSSDQFGESMASGC